MTTQTEERGVDSLQSQWGRVGDLRSRLVRGLLSETQRSGLSWLAVADSMEDGEDRLETLESAERFLNMSEGREFNGEIWGELREAITTLKELEEGELGVSS